MRGMILVCAKQLLLQRKTTLFAEGLSNRIRGWRAVSAEGFARQHFAEMTCFFSHTHTQVRIQTILASGSQC